MCCDSTSTATSGCSERIVAAARSPSSVCVGGMRMSVITSSGRVRSTSVSSASASAASPTTSKPSSARRRTTPERMSAASSATTTRHGATSGIGDHGTVASATGSAKPLSVDGSDRIERHVAAGPEEQRTISLTTICPGSAYAQMRWASTTAAPKTSSVAPPSWSTTTSPTLQPTRSPTSPPPARRPARLPAARQSRRASLSIRRVEQRHDAVAQGLGDAALVAFDRVTRQSKVRGDRGSSRVVAGCCEHLGRRRDVGDQDGRGPRHRVRSPAIRPALSLPYRRLGRRAPRSAPRPRHSVRGCGSRRSSCRCR